MTDGIKGICWIISNYRTYIEVIIQCKFISKRISYSLLGKNSCLMYQFLQYSLNITKFSTHTKENSINDDDEGQETFNQKIPSKIMSK